MHQLVVNLFRELSHKEWLGRYWDLVPGGMHIVTENILFAVNEKIEELRTPEAITDYGYRGDLSIAPPSCTLELTCTLTIIAG